MDANKHEIFQKLATDNEFMEKFTVLQIAKQHNLYGMVDSYMRSFGRICVSEIQDGGIIAKRLEALLNKQIAIADPSKQAAFNPEKTGGRPLKDYETVDPGVLAQPDFQFMPAGWKIAKIEEYHRMRSELAKTKETR